MPKCKKCKHEKLSQYSKCKCEKTPYQSSTDYSSLDSDTSSNDYAGGGGEFGGGGSSGDY